MARRPSVSPIRESHDESKGGRGSRTFGFLRPRLPMTCIVGDPALAARAQDLLGNRHRVVAVARVTPEGVETATMDAGVDDADFEIGSISKGVTGLLYVDAVERGEVTPETRLGELLPIGPSGACGVTLGSLATHSSGLPRLAPGSHPWRGAVELWTKGTNPYGESLDRLVEQVREVRLGSGRPRYSNVGFSLLGHAVAAAAGTTYAGLVRRRLAEPLRLNPFYVAANPADLGPTAMCGTNRSGRAVEPWTGEAIAPAGGVRASIGAMARLIQSLLEGAAPGLAALDPVRDFSRGVRIGGGWITISARGRAVTWHNGGTGGFRSWLGVDRQAGCGVVVLSATSRSVDRCGFRLLEDVAPPT